MIVVLYIMGMGTAEWDGKDRLCREGNWEGRIAKPEVSV